MRAIPERLRDASCGGAIQIDYLQYIPVIITLKKMFTYIRRIWHVVLAINA